MNDTNLLNVGMKTLIANLGAVEAERFIYLINKEPFDYTKFRHELFEGMTLEDVCQEAAEAKQEADNRNT